MLTNQGRVFGPIKGSESRMNQLGARGGAFSGAGRALARRTLFSTENERFQRKTGELVSRRERLHPGPRRGLPGGKRAERRGAGQVGADRRGAGLPGWEAPDRGSFTDAPRSDRVHVHVQSRQLAPARELP